MPAILWGELTQVSKELVRSPVFEGLQWPNLGNCMLECVEFTFDLMIRSVN